MSGDWGYLGWGYVDTVSSSMNMVTSDTGDPASIPSDGKTIVMPAIVALLGGWISAAGAAYFWSLLLTALTAAGIATLATLLWRNDYAGVAAGALFAVEPMTLGYALSFYQELGFVAAFTWGIFFAVTGVAAGSRARFIAGAVLVSLAVCCKSPVLAVEIIFLTFALFLALGVSARTAAVVAVQYGALALLTAVATWPFLWVDTLQRVGYAFFARVVVDKTLHLSAPFVARAFNAVSQTVVHTGPVCAVLVILSIAYLAREKLWSVLFGLLGAITVGVGLVVPTSMYIEHYWFYVIPALPLLACAVVVPLTQRISAARLVRVALGGLIGAELMGPRFLAVSEFCDSRLFVARVQFKALGRGRADVWPPGGGCVDTWAYARYRSHRHPDRTAYFAGPDSGVVLCDPSGCPPMLSLRES